MTTKIGIIGAGAIGCFVGGYLISPGHEVYFLGRARLGNEIQKSGLTVTSLDGVSIHHKPASINWVLNFNELPELDIVIVTTKSQDTLASITEIQSKIKKEAVIISLQNGLSNTKVLKSALPQHKIITGMVLYNVSQLNNVAHFKQASKGDIYLSENVDALKVMSVKVVDDIVAIQWGKLLKNLNNALNALSNRPLIIQLRDRNERRLLSKIAKEALAVLKKHNIPVKNTSLIPIAVFPIALTLPDAVFNFISKSEFKIDPQARLSMWQDLELKRKTEIEYLNGEIAEMARQCGMLVPYNQKIIELISLAESGELELARSQYKKLVESFST